MLTSLWNGLKYLFFGILFLMIGFIVWIVGTDFSDYNLKELVRLPNYNYIPDIKRIREEGRLQEALELTRFVLRHPDMPGQEEARELEKELDVEINSLLGKAKRVVKGFVLGSGNSIEEVIGGVSSDMIVWGDFRDLIKQGYYKITGNDTDPVIVALASIGLLTEVFDIVDWAPAVLKAFRKVGALSKKFADFIIISAKKSLKIGRLDDELKVVFKSLSGLVDKIGLARSAVVMKHIDTAEDLASVAKVAEKSSDVAYLMVKNGGSDGVALIKQLGNTEDGIRAMSEAVKKGPAGIQWLKKGGAGRKYVLLARIGARLGKNWRFGRIQEILRWLMENYPALRIFFYLIIGISLIISALAFVKSFLYFKSLLALSKSRTVSTT